MILNINDFLVIGHEVRVALEEKRPIVALESTIISHGMPFPQNYETAMLLENEVRSNGAIPATIAIIQGKIRVGLEKKDIEYIATDKNVHKVSRRDVPYIIASGLNGATTVASTMIFAQMAGIRIFATGGIGGVHRGGEISLDISADLYELSNTNVAVICAGAKSILDIGLTLEKLETLGVPVVGYKTDDFPAFYTRKSGFKLDLQMQTPLEIAKMIRVKTELGLKGGMVVANPIPLEFEADGEKINASIEIALIEAAKLGIRGKEVTPFLLKKVKELTGGDSLESNISLVKNNADLAAKIAVQLSGIM